MTETGSLKLGLPDGFYQVQDQADVEALVAGFGLPEEPAGRLKIALDNARQFAGRATGWAMIIAPSTGYVDAILTMTPHRLDEDDTPSAYLDQISSFGDEIVRRRAELTTIASRPAVTAHDFAVPTGGHNPAQERAFAAVFLSASIMLEFTLITQDMRLFEDASVYLSDLLEQGLQVSYDA